jgi:hypothetical protein
VGFCETLIQPSRSVHSLLELSLSLGYGIPVLLEVLSIEPELSLQADDPLPKLDGQDDLIGARVAEAVRHEESGRYHAE